MPRRFLPLLLLLPALALAQAALSPDEARRAEQTMSEWLAHPMEFGVKPKRAKYLSSVQTRIAGMSKSVSVHIVEYEMPDGTYGRGFVNPVTWSFLGPIPYDKLTDSELVTAYSGWLWIFSALNKGRAQTQFEPQTLKALLSELAREGITDVSVKEQYKVGSSEFFGFAGQRGGSKVKGAGSAGSKLIYDESAPQASLPIVYTYLGKVMRGEI